MLIFNERFKYFLLFTNVSGGKMVEYFCCIGCGKPVTKGKVIIDKRSYDVKGKPYVILHCPSGDKSKEIEDLNSCVFGYVGIVCEGRSPVDLITINFSELEKLVQAA